MELRFFHHFFNPPILPFLNVFRSPIFFYQFQTTLPYRFSVKISDPIFLSFFNVFRSPQYFLSISDHHPLRFCIKKKSDSYFLTIFQCRIKFQTSPNFFDPFQTPFFASKNSDPHILTIF